MRKLLTLALMMLSTSMMAQSVQQLPAPKFDKKSNMSLIDVLQKRESVREYAADPLTLQHSVGSLRHQPS